MPYGAEEPQMLKLMTDDFNFGEEVKGTDDPAASDNPFAYEPHRQKGSRWNFTITANPLFADVVLKFPSVLVDGESVNIPQIHFSPYIAQQCFTYH